MLVGSLSTSTMFLEKMGSSRSSPIRIGTFFFSPGYCTWIKKVSVPSKIMNSSV